MTNTMDLILLDQVYLIHVVVLLSQSSHQDLQLHLNHSHVIVPTVERLYPTSAHFLISWIMINHYLLLILTLKLLYSPSLKLIQIISPHLVHLKLRVPLLLFIIISQALHQLNLKLHLIPTRVNTGRVR